MSLCHIFFPDSVSDIMEHLHASNMELLHIYRTACKIMRISNIIKYILK
jgi:hypothetical protein